MDAFSTDGTWELIQDWASKSPRAVRAVQKAGGISVGRNEGFRLATSDLVAVTDADMRVPPDWLQQLVAAMDDPRIGVVGGPNETANTDLVSRCVATIPTHGPSRGAVFAFKSNQYHRDFTTDRDVYAAVTRNSLFRRQAVEEAGGFDEAMVVTEDPELNQRILKAGYKLRYRRAAEVKHVHRNTLGGFFRQQRAYAVYQAVANRKHPELFQAKHWAPPLALLVTILSLLGSPFSWAASMVAGGLLALGLLLTLAYTVQAVVVKRDAALLVLLPLFFLAWQAAWATGYPVGVWRARRAR